MMKINFFLLTLFFLTACSGFKEAGKILRNEKTNSTDEFLVKKREPLVLPPDYNKIPEPNSQEEDNKAEDKNKIKEILKNSEENTTSSDSTTSTEKKILEKIRK